MEMEIKMVFQKKNVFELLADFSHPHQPSSPQPGDYKGFKLADGEKKGGKWHFWSGNIAFSTVESCQKH